MVLLAAGLYILCTVGFLVQFCRHSRHHFAEEMLVTHETAEIIELFPSASVTERAA